MKFFILLIIVSPLSAFAYVDPGNGLILWQGLIAGLGVLVMLIQSPIRTIKNWLIRRRSRK
jgi:hypothetical protein